MLTTEQIVQVEVDTYIDRLYGYLIKDGLELPESLKSLFDVAGIKDSSDIAFILDGIEDSYKPDYSYINMDGYRGFIYWHIPFGEIEVPAEEVACNDDFVISGDYGYHFINAVMIKYNPEKVKDAISDFLP